MSVSRFKSSFVCFAWLMGASLVLVALFLGLGKLGEPRGAFREFSERYDPEDIARVLEDRRAAINPPTDLPPIWQDVDYSDGTNAAWYPKAQSPLLAELCEQGVLPPL